MDISVTQQHQPGLKPWERLRGTATCRFEAGESVLQPEDFEAGDVVELLPVDADVIVGLHALPASFHGDPADRLIVATARTHGLTLATQDRQIRKSRLTKIWKH